MKLNVIVLHTNVKTNDNLILTDMYREGKWRKINGERKQGTRETGYSWHDSVKPLCLLENNSERSSVYL